MADKMLWRVYRVCLVGWGDAVLFLRHGRLLFARHASPLVQDPSG